MNDAELRQLADGVSRVLRPHLERSEVLRQTVSLIGKWLCEEAERIGTDGKGTIEGPGVPADTAADRRQSETTAATNARAVIVASAMPAAPRVSSALVPLKIGDAVVHVPTSGTTEELGRARQSAAERRASEELESREWAIGFEVDLALVEKRCRLKADSCRLFIEKRGLGDDPEDESGIRRRMNDMIALAKSLPDCFLWVFWRERTPPGDEALRRIAECYDAHAEAVALMRKVDGLEGGTGSDDEAAGLHLLAEANSALRVALGETWLTNPDHDQSAVHGWLRQETAKRRVFIERHMTIDDPADPANVSVLRGRLKEAMQQLEERAGRSKGIKQAIGQIRYHAGHVVRSGMEDSSRHWQTISEAIDRLAELGVRATDRRIAEAIGPEAAALWPVGRGGESVLGAVIARAAALRGGSSDDEDDGSAVGGRAWSESVLEVRSWLRGRRLVLIGGERNASAIERLIEAFELHDAEWVSLTEHGSGVGMRAPISRPDTAVVVVIVKLTGHLHAEEAREYSSAAEKPCVLLSGGYNPERVALAILEQASSRLQR